MECATQEVPKGQMAESKKQRQKTEDAGEGEENKGGGKGCVSRRTGDEETDVVCRKMAVYKGKMGNSGRIRCLALIGGGN